PHTPTLPAFPTRRSSDLNRNGAHACGDRSRLPGRRHLLRPAEEIEGQDDPAHREVVVRRAAAEVVQARRTVEEPGDPVDLGVELDRKSTRLDSSHVAISY